MNGLVETRSESPSAPLRAAAARTSECVHTVVESFNHKGGRLITTYPRRFVIGEGLRLDLSLPGAASLRMLGIVRRVQRESGSAIQRLDLDARGLEPPAREALVSAARAHERGRTAPIRARLSEKFELSLVGDRLTISMVGSLTATEARVLGELIDDELADELEPRAKRPLVVCIDASRFCPCPEAALEWMGQWLKRLASEGPMLGVLVGASSVGMMQLQRLARAAGVAEHLMICNGLAEAKSTLDAMSAELFGGER